MLILLSLCLAAFGGTLKVHVLDVGQGDAILLEAPGDKKVLIDSGTSGAKVVAKLRARGITKLNLIIATHPHADHIGGMPSIVKDLDVGMYVDNGMTHTTLTYARVMGAVEKTQIPYRAGMAGRTFNVGEDVKITVLHPRPLLLRGTRSDLNSNSVVIRVDHKKDCFLLMGDAEEATERALLSRGIEPCDVLKVAHHGSRYSTSEAWLRAIQPKFAAISVGDSNRYGHPAPETLERLKHYEVEIHRTDQEGTISFVSTGRKITVTSERPLSGWSGEIVPAESPVIAPEELPAPNPDELPAPSPEDLAAPNPDELPAPKKKKPEPKPRNER